MDKWVGKVAIVTGASSGIGARVAQKLVEEGMQVVGIARRVQLVEELTNKLTEEPGKLHPLKCDITSEDEVKEAFQWILDNIGPVAVLINNAGIVAAGYLTDLEPKVWKNVMDTNFFGTALCTQQAILQMKAAEIDGQIININSLAGHKVIDNDGTLNMNIYCSTKHAVTAFTEIMRQELRNQGSKIKISSLSPGITCTELFKVANLGPLADPENFQQMPHLLPEDLADAVIYILGTKPHVQIQELTVKPVGEMI